MVGTEVENKIVEYESNGQIIKLSPGMIKKYLVSGDAANVTDAEVMMFLNLCRYQRLNPFLREAYCIKYGNSPATMVVGKGTYEKRAARNKLYKGFEAGVIVADSKGVMTNRTGAMVLKGETLLGGWAKVHVSGYEIPIESTVSFEEYVGRKKSGEVTEQWLKKPATMIRKVAMVQALREAFPEDMEGLPYAAEELNVNAAEEEAPISGAPLELMPSDEPMNEVPAEKDPF